MGLYEHPHNERMKKPLISNIIISSINVSECSERALGEITLSHFKLEVRLKKEERGTLIDLLEKKRNTFQSTKGNYQR